MPAVCYPGKHVTEQKPRHGTGDADEQSLQYKNCSDLFSPGAHGHEHGNIAGAIGDGHGQHYQNIQAGDKRDQPDEKRGHQFFEAQRTEESPVLVHPSGHAESLACALQQVLRDLRHVIQFGYSDLK